MKCVSCQTEIDPKWKHALNNNVCPFCGSSIMEELLKSLLSVLQDTMEKMQQYPDQLNDWMLSNYSFIKTNSSDLKNYLPKEILKDMKKEHDQEEFEKRKSIIKVKVEQGKEEEVVTETVLSDSKTASFFQRAGVVKPGSDDTGDPEDTPVSLTAKPKSKTTFRTASEKTDYIKGLKKKIESEGAQAVVDETGLAAMITPEMMDNADPEVVAEMQAALSGSDIVSSGLSGMPNLEDEDVLADKVLAMNQAASGGKNKGHSGGYNEQDMRTLVDMQQRRLRSQQSFETGENRGKGGFSRS